MSSDPTPPIPPSDHREPDSSADTPFDHFAPPAEPCECYCLHCHRVFMSDGMWFQKVINAADGFKGFWKCATPNCDGAGFTFDIFPTDPTHPANEGWTSDDGEDDEDDQASNVYDPTEPKYSELDEQYDDDDDLDDLEGEEWKHGLAPGERPPEPPWVIEARQQWEEEQLKYDATDERPRVLDWSDKPIPHKPEWPSGDIGEEDIPF